MDRFLVIAVGGVFAAGVSAAGPVKAAPHDGCGVNLAAETVQTALNVQQPPFPDSQWSRDPATFDGNYNPCATLSVAIAPLDGGTGSSPSVALLFNRDLYVGPATPTPRGFTSFAPAGTTDDTVALTYKVPGSCNACGDATFHTVRYQWTDGENYNFGKVIRLDPLPPG